LVGLAEEAAGSSCFSGLFEHMTPD